MERIDIQRISEKSFSPAVHVMLSTTVRPMTAVPREMFELMYLLYYYHTAKGRKKLIVRHITLHKLTTNRAITPI
jgi:hypothetical protein